MIFKIYDCDFGIKVGGVDYRFTHVLNMTIDDPEVTNLTRGSNAANKVGIVFREGIRDAKTITVTIMEMSLELKAVLDAAFQNQTRLDVYAISRVDGSSKMAKNAVLTAQPQQLNLDDSQESANVDLVFKSFDLSEVHKS